jgi:hypothetical protein
MAKVARAAEASRAAARHKEPYTHDGWLQPEVLPEKESLVPTQIGT